MFTRRNFVNCLTVLTGYAITMIATVGAASSSPNPETHEILMLNAAADDPEKPNVFTPPILRVKVGDSVTFVPTDSGHNSASKRGMIPENAEPWNGGIDEKLTVKFTIPGIYGYICVPHYEMGMVGVIIVGEDISNLKQVKKIRHPGQARKAFRGLLKSIEISVS